MECGITGSDRWAAHLLRRLLAIGVVVATLAVTARPGRAESIEGHVKDAQGKPVAEAIIFATNVAGVRAPARTGRAIVDQQDKQFVPHVRPIIVGTEVTFPNKDDIRHHVYSFSAAKKFELPLYKGTQAPPVKFDKPGVVVLGCNIHDWMVGYVNVLETPYFETTAADGRARLADLPPGTYEVQVWHPRMPESSTPPKQRVTLGGGKDERIEFVTPLKSDLRPFRAPAGAGGTRYR